MKNIRWAIIILSLICGIFFGLIVGLISNNARYGFIAMGIVTLIMMLALCLVSMSD